VIIADVPTGANRGVDLEPDGANTDPDIGGDLTAIVEASDAQIWPLPGPDLDDLDPVIARAIAAIAAGVNTGTGQPPAPAGDDVDATLQTSGEADPQTESSPAPCSDATPSSTSGVIASDAFLTDPQNSINTFAEHEEEEEEPTKSRRPISLFDAQRGPFYPFAEGNDEQITPKCDNPSPDRHDPTSSGFGIAPYPITEPTSTPTRPPRKVSTTPIVVKRIQMDNGMEMTFVRVAERHA
jgi:hypothetical protein